MFVVGDDSTPAGMTGWGLNGYGAYDLGFLKQWWIGARLGAVDAGS